MFVEQPQSHRVCSIYLLTGPFFTNLAFVGSMECSIRAYAVLEQSAEYQQLLDNRKVALLLPNFFLVSAPAFLLPLEKINHL